MKASELQTFIETALKTRDFPSLFIWGGPGIGKSSIVSAAAKATNRQLIDVRASLLDPTDARGIPVPDLENKTAVWLSPSFLPRDGQAVLFLDELNCAPPAVQNSLLQLIIPPHRLGEYQLPEDCYIIAAGNREQEGFVHKMSPALLNRFMHITLDVDVDEWAQWAWRNNIASIVIAFLQKFKPDLLYKLDTSKKVNPTPRSWEFVSRIYLSDTPDYLKYEAIAGAVGEGAAIEFNAYQKIWAQLPDLDEILDGKDIIPEDPQLKYAVCVGLVSKADTVKHYDRLIDYALKFSQREFTIYLVKSLARKNAEKLRKAPNWPTFAKTVVCIEEILV